MRQGNEHRESQHVIERTVGLAVSHDSFHSQVFLFLSLKFYLVLSWRGVGLQGQRADGKGWGDEWLRDA